MQSHKFEPSESPDLTPSQIAAWYRDVGGNYDLLFKDTPPSSIAFIYRSLGAFHSLQPAPSDDGYSSPAVPALKKQGFVTWQTIQLLLGPEEHVPFLQRAVEQYDVVDPDTGNIFPKILPKECFPDKPDDAMEIWYEGVAARLKKEADDEAAHARIPADPHPTDDGSSADERNGAFKYFEDPMYRKARPRPGFMRHVSKQQAINPNDDSRGSTVTQRVRHMLNPFNGRKKSMPGRYESDSLSDEDRTPIASQPPAMPRYGLHKRPHPQRRASSLSTTDSEDDEGRPPSRRRTPDLRERRSHEPMAPREYFPTYYDGHSPHQQQQHYPAQRPSSKATSPQPHPHPTYGPTKSPLFATHVAQKQMEARNYYDRRPSMPPRTTYRPVPVPQNARYSSAAASVSPPNPPYARDYHRDRHESSSRDRDRGPDTVSYDMSTGTGTRSRHRRRSTEDATYPRERLDAARTRSHDRVKDEWDDGDSSREGSRERSGDRDRGGGGRVHRYAVEREREGGVQGGVSGRRYPVAAGNY